MRTKAATTERRSISHQLRRAIEEDGRTAYAIGQSAEVDAGMIQRFLNGERGLSLATVDRLSLALGLRLVEGAKGRGRPTKATRPVAAELVEDLDAAAIGPPAEATTPGDDWPRIPSPGPSAEPTPDPIEANLVETGGIELDPIGQPAEPQAIPSAFIVHPAEDFEHREEDDQFWKDETNRLES